MAATKIGTYGTWGIASTETGTLVETVKYDFAFRTEKPVIDLDGETQGFALADALCTITITGLMNGFDGLIGAALTLVNAIPSHMTTTTGKVVTKSISRTIGIEDFDRVEITATSYPIIAAA